MVLGLIHNWTTGPESGLTIRASYNNSNEGLLTFIFVKCPKVDVHLFRVRSHAFINLDANDAI